MAALAGAGAVWLCGCASNDDAAGAGTTAGTSTPTTVEVVPAALAATPTSTAALADPQLVAACVEYVQFQAYVGDPQGREIWTRAGETVEGLHDECTTMTLDDASLVAAMRDELAERQSEAADEATANASTTLAPGCHRSYSNCLPIVSDIDCLATEGADGPVFQALSVLVYGFDDYELDGDDDGLGCEPGDR